MIQDMFMTKELLHHFHSFTRRILYIAILHANPPYTKAIKVQKIWFKCWRDRCDPVVCRSLLSTEKNKQP